MRKALLTILLAAPVASFAQNGNFKLDKEYKISKTGTLDLRSSDAKVFITGSARETAHVKIERSVLTKGWTWGGQEFRVDVDEENGNLVIREHTQGSHIGVVGYYEEKYKIEIEVPMGVSLVVKGDDGDYFIKYIASSISLDLDDADADLRNCNGTSFSFRLDDGDLIMDKAQGKLEIVADDADIEISDGNLTEIDARIDDGDLIIQTSLAADGKYQFNTQDGTIVLNITKGDAEFDIRHDDGRVGTEGNFKLIEKSEDRTRLSLGNASAKVSIKIDDGKVRLTSR